MTGFRLMIDFTAETDDRANRITQVIGNALAAASIPVQDARLEQRDPAAPFPRHDRAVQTAAAPTGDEAQ